MYLKKISILFLILLSILFLIPSCTSKSNPKIDSVLRALIEAEKRGEAESFAQQNGIELVDGNKVVVQIDCRGDQLDTAVKAASRFGTVKVSSAGGGKGLIKAIIPIESLINLAKEPSIRFITTPIRPVEAK